MGLAHHKIKIGATVGGVIILGLGIGLAGRNPDPQPWNYISSVLGWLYFFAWSVSFYPQLFLNWSRRSASGLSMDFLWFNLLGFSCYSAYSIGFYAVPSIQGSYRKRNKGKENLVTLNDVVFASHACSITALTLLQVYCLGYEKERVSILCKITSGVICFAILLFAIIAEPIDTLYFVSFVKLVVSVFKYLPQVYLNFKRRSTVGWSMGNVFLDFTGGCLSTLQLLIDGGSTDNWPGVIRNPIKFGLGFVSMGFDLVFMLQHFILFSDSMKPESYEVEERAELILGDENRNAVVQSG